MKNILFVISFCTFCAASYAQSFRKAAENGDADAQYKLGLSYFMGTNGFSNDDAEAFVWFQKAAKQKHTKAQVRLAICYNNGYGVEINDEPAAAAQGHEDAIVELEKMQE